MGRIQHVAQGTSLFVYLFISLFVAQVNFTYTFKLKKKVPDQYICMHPTIPSVVPIEPMHIPTIQNSALLHSFHIRTHHKHLYTDLAKISRPPSQKSAGPAYMHAAHNSNCGTNRTQAHPHNTKQCTFCTHFTFALTICTYIDRFG